MVTYHQCYTREQLRLWSCVSGVVCAELCFRSCVCGVVFNCTNYDLLVSHSINDLPDDRVYYADVHTIVLVKIVCIMCALFVCALCVYTVIAMAVANINFIDQTSSWGILLLLN